MRNSLHRIAVLTGDLVNSTELGATKIGHAFKVMEDCARDQADWHGAPLHFTRHRGDGWQVVLAKPEMALRSALAFRAALRALGAEYDTYLAAFEGAGTIDPKNSDLNEETSEVFTHSGRKLETIKSGETIDAMRTANNEIRMLHQGHSGATTAAFILADGFARDWTPSQAEAFQHALAPQEVISLTKIAERVGHTRQAVTKSLKAAGLRTIIPALIAIEDRESPND